MRPQRKSKRKSKGCRTKTSDTPVIESEILLLESSHSLLELVNASACVNELLLTGEERMALGADINSHLAAIGRLGYNSLAACTLNGAGLILRMDSVFHCFYLISNILMFFDIESRISCDKHEYYIISFVKKQDLLKSFFIFYLFYPIKYTPEKNFINKRGRNSRNPRGKMAKTDHEPTDEKT